MKESTTPPDLIPSWKESEKILTRRINQTRRQIRFVDCFSIITALAAIGGGILFLGILADHILFAHGLSQQGRLYYFGGFLAALFLYLIYRLYPLLRYRINPLYAADVLEKSNSGLKNGLINWLLLKNRQKQEKNKSQNPSENSPQTAEERFLQELAVKTAVQIEIPTDETAVDFSPVIRWGIAFVIIFAIFCGYSVFSAKSPFISTGRLLLPFAAIDAPQSVRFLEIKPGGASYYQGKQITISAEILGTKGLPVWLRYSTADGRILNQNIPMDSPRLNRFEILFPPDDKGLQESLDYQIIVGDNDRTESRSSLFHLDIKPAMTVTVHQIIAHYPDYIHLPPLEFKNQGDFRALEGSKIEILTKSNVPVSSGLFVPNSKVIQGIPLEISAEDSAQGKAAFTLKRRVSSESEGITPEFANYQILITDCDGNQNIENPEDPQNGANRYQIEIFEDLPPVIRWKEIPQNAIEIPLDEEFPMTLLAADSDFGLDTVRIDFQFKEKQGERQDLPSAARKREIPPLPLFSAPKDSKPTLTQEMRFEGKISPKKLSLTPGDEIEFKGIALDGRRPKANQNETESLTFTVLPPKNPNAPDVSDEGENESGESGQNDGQKENTGQGEQDNKDDSSQGDKNDSQQGESESSKDQDQQSSHQKGSSEQNAENGPNESESGSSELKGSKSERDQSGEDSDKSESSEQENGGEPEEGENQEGNSDSSEGQSQSPQNPSSSTTPQEGNPNQGTPQNEENQTETGENSDNGASSDSNKSPNEKGNGKNSESDSAEGTPQESNRKSDPIDPETNPGDAFEAILKQMEEDTALPSGNEPSAAATGPTDPDRPKKASNREIDSDSLQEGEGSLPDGKRQQGEAPDEIPSGTPRENGDVDPESQNYMTVDSPEIDPNQTESVSPDAHVTQDPDHPAQGAAASPEESQGRDVRSQNPSNDNSKGEGIPEKDGDSDPSSAESNESSAQKQNLPQDSSQPSPASGNSPNQSTDPPINSETPPQADGTPSGNPSEKTPSRDDFSPKDSDSLPSDQDGPSAGYRGQGGAAAGTLFDGEDAAPGDSPHLRYTQKATALALEYLEDQIQKGPDQELLNRLGWSEEELKAFWTHWNEMKKNASGLPDSDAARKDYLDALRDLGLRDPQEDSLSLHRRGDDYRTHLQSREKRKSPPPREFQDRFRLYNEGISRQK